MKRFLYILVVAIVFAGCTKNTALFPQEAYADDEVYHSYPCTPNCQAFQIGFDNASSREFTHKDQCFGASLEEITGCKAYVKEYEIEHKSFDQLIKDF